LPPKQRGVLPPSVTLSMPPSCWASHQVVLPATRTAADCVNHVRIGVRAIQVSILVVPSY